MINRKAERWTGRLGVILAVAGSAIGLSSFLRFPTEAARYGGGTFMIPYLCALICCGIPLVWMEWAFGRYGGIWGRHNLPGIFDAVTRRPWGKYLGVLGLYAPFIIIVYYLYVESWTLGYTFYSAIGKFTYKSALPDTTYLFNHYLGIGGQVISLPIIGLVFLLITLALNFYILNRGEAGIDKFTTYAMPVFCLFSVGLMVYLFLTRSFHGVSIWRGLDYAWKPDLHALADPAIWLSATGQVLFTLSLGLGAVITYTSFLRKDDDVALSGLTSLSINELVEIVLAGTLVLPMAIIFFGPHATTATAQQHAFSLGFMTLPIIFGQLPHGDLLGALWFLLLFFSGLTASVSLMKPIVAFFEDELHWTRAKTSWILLVVTIAYLAPVVLLQKYGFLDEMDFWAVNIVLLVGALVETVIFIAVLGMARGWEGITTGARMHVPVIFKYILYITPIFLLGTLAWWAWMHALPKLMLTDLPATIAKADLPYRMIVTIASRVTMGLFLLLMLLAIRFAAARARARATELSLPTPTDEEVSSDVS